MFDTYFTQFCKTNNIEHTNIRPVTTDKSVAQTAITSAKQLLIRCKLEEEDFHTALVNMREDPTNIGPSVRQIFMGTGQRRTTPKEEKPQQAAQEKQTKTTQDELEVGGKVLIKHQQAGRWDREAEVVKQREDKLSYVIKDNTGQILIHG